MNLPYDKLEYCCHIRAGAPSCYLELLDKLQKQIYRTVDLSLAASLGPLAYCRNKVSLSLFYRYYFGRYSSDLAHLVPLPFSLGTSTCYSERLYDFSVKDCMTFLSPFLDITKMLMSTVSFLAQLNPGILCLNIAF